MLLITEPSFIFVHLGLAYILEAVVESVDQIRLCGTSCFAKIDCTGIILHF